MQQAQKFKLIPGNMGIFTAFDIEYVGEYLGENWINAKISENYQKPTMGIPINEIFIDGSWGLGKGIFDVFSYLVGLFQDDTFTKYIFSCSKKYNKENYYSGENLSKEWNRYLAIQERYKIRRNQPLKEYRKWTKNMFWIEYHFLISQIIKQLYQPRKKEIDKDFIEVVFFNYMDNIEIVTTEIKESILWPEYGLGNFIFRKMRAYFKKQKNNEILSLIESKAEILGWRI